MGRSGGTICEPVYVATEYHGGTGPKIAFSFPKVKLRCNFPIKQDEIFKRLQQF